VDRHRHNGSTSNAPTAVPRLNDRCLKAQLLEGDVRRAAGGRGMTLQANLVRCNPHADTLHWIFREEGGRQVLHYWPGNGKVWSPATGDKGTAADPWAALEAASKAGSGVPLGTAASEPTLFDPPPGSAAVPEPASSLPAADDPMPPATPRGPGGRNRTSPNSRPGPAGRARALLSLVRKFRRSHDADARRHGADRCRCRPCIEADGLAGTGKRKGTLTPAVAAAPMAGE
jgi:hypothetical protein